ncbi:protein-arginine omega-N asymmetric methyltransferase [Aureococcus anophagefferens]|nr:protein-arginine omega-N asymmetric methyltransferase [Aureococcus anophagefferens]
MAAALEVSTEASTVAAKHDLLPTVLQRVATAMCLPDDDVAALSPALRRKLDGVAAGVAARDAKLLPGGFAAGDRVEVFGLVAAADRNGSRGVAQRREKDRVAVVLDDGARLAVKPENLRLAPSKPRDDDVAASLEPSSEPAAGAEDPVDVVVAEILDAALLGEGVLPALADAYRKHPGAAFCPRLATLRVTPASSPALARRFVADGVRAFQPYDVVEGLAYEPLAPPVDMDLDLIELARRAAPADGTRRRVTIPGGFGETTVTRRGRLDALVVSFVLRDGDRSLDSAAGHWREACFFVEERPELDVGAALRISASTAPLDHGEGDALRFDVAAPSASIAVPPKAPRNALDATTDDVARFNDGAYRAAHARAVAAATPERGRVLELGFCDARSNDGPALPAFGPATLRCPGGRAASIVAAASGDRFDVLAHSLVEPSGLLRRDALQEVEALKRFALKAGTVGAPRVLPSAATVFGVLVDAPALAATKFTREGRLGDHDVSALDDRADATLRDLAPAACARLPALCAPFPLLDLNLDVRSASVAEEAARAAVASSPPVSTPGAAHALLFWWHLRYGGEHGAVAETVSTAPALDGGETGDGHWRVAGVVLDRGRGLPLARGDVLDVHLAVRGSKVGVLKTVTRRAKDGGAAANRPA